MDCRSFQHKILFFIEGETTNHETIYIEKHIEECNKCRQLYNRMSAEMNGLQSVKNVEAKPFMFTRVEARLAEKQRLSTGWSKSRVLQPLLIAAGFFLGIYIGVMVALSIIPNARQQAATETENTVEQYAGDLHINEFQYETIENYLLEEQE